MAKQSTQQAIPVLVTREQDHRGNAFLSMSINYNGQCFMTECDSRDQGLAELSAAVGLPLAAFYLTEAE